MILSNIDVAAWSPSGDVLALGSGEFQVGGAIHVWNSVTEKLTALLQSTPYVNSLAWSPDGRLLAVGLGEFDTSGLQVFDRAGGLLFDAIPDRNRTMQAQWLSDSQSVLAVTESSVTLWDVGEQTLSRSLVASAAKSSDLVAVGWSADGSALVTDQSNQGREDMYVEWNANTGQAVRMGSASSPYDTWWPKRAPQSVGEALVPPTGSLDLVSSVMKSPDGTLIAVAFNSFSRKPNGDVTIWSTVRNQLVARLTGFQWWIYSLDWSHDGKMLAASGGIPYGNGSPYVEGWDENKIILWDTSNWSVLKTFVGHTGQTRDLAFSPDDSRLASASADGTVIIWQIK